MRIGAMTFRSDGLAILEREGAPDVVTETTVGELPRLLLDTYGRGARLVSRPSSGGGPLCADVVRVETRRAA